ncbi:MAG TPA: formylglycine-generating enzyme family protein, partial [Roseimicrobium sp.]|nr:formylglycine-generating enzyme family protein [Roseimicrobium sp.]
TMRGRGLGHAMRIEEADPPIAGVVPKDSSWTNGMVWIPGGVFLMGSEKGQADEKPVHEVEVDGFWIDRTEVTNEEFLKFVKATGYVTVAERKPDAKDFPGVPPENLIAGSIVFNPPPGDDIPLNDHMIWWTYVPGANWRHPEGPESTIQGREKHPVVHISWIDAAAYCKWAGKRLPTEAEWEYASRGGLSGAEYGWGNELTPAGKQMANIWQGKFPNNNTLEDGFRGTAPVGSFSPNGYGLYDMAGNVWEWVQDWYTPDYYGRSPRLNPQGCLESESFDPNEPGLKKRIQRGGSYLCTDLYCGAYRPSRRMKTSPDTGLSHAGFRCVKVASPPPGAALRIVRPATPVAK